MLNNSFVRMQEQLFCMEILSLHLPLPCHRSFQTSSSNSKAMAERPALPVGSALKVFHPYGDGCVTVEVTHDGFKVQPFGQEQTSAEAHVLTVVFKTSGSSSEDSSGNSWSTFEPLHISDIIVAKDPPSISTTPFPDMTAEWDAVEKGKFCVRNMFVKCNQSRARQNQHTRICLCL